VTTTRLPPLPPNRPDVAAWVAAHLGDLSGDDADASPSFRGGQTAADAALQAFDVSGYAAARNEVWPPGRRGASRLSPYIRHGLLPLRRVWDAVARGPARDVASFRAELLWQEYARHLYARMGEDTRRSLRAAPARTAGAGDPWDTRMACVGTAVAELEREGWLPNQARMWLASQWTVRTGAWWQDGEERFFRHLLDGSRAANRLGWQWTAGALTGRPYGLGRDQVEKRAPGICAGCELRDRCPIERWPDSPPPERLEGDPRLRADDDPQRTAGPAAPEIAADPETVWITAESLGDDDPALAAHPGLPAVFVFDEPLLRRLVLSSKRLVFLAETLADLAGRREVEVHRGTPAAVLAGRRPAVTFAPVPGWRRRAARIGPAAVHPWPWLIRPGPGPVSSFSAWRKHVDA
jgi:deoxyribodipyrimidine photo-lyase